MKSVSVFCGASPGNDSQIRASALELGEALAKRGITLVYGGGSVGLMGLVADGALAKGGRVIGIIPKFLNSKEVAHPGLTQTIECETMHERKAKMFAHSEGFIALPGGFGTLEEVIEILTWRQLDLHRFPIAFLNVGGYYDHLRELFLVMESRALLRPEYRGMPLFVDSVPELLRQMAAAGP